MAFSDYYKAIRTAHRADIATVFSLASTAIHNGVPETEVNTAHAVLRARPLESSYDHPVATGKNLGMTIVIDVEVWLAMPANTTVLEDVALAYADSMAALVEANPTYGTHGMIPVLSAWDMSDLVGMQEGSGNAQLHISYSITCLVQRPRG